MNQSQNLVRAPASCHVPVRPVLSLALLPALALLQAAYADVLIYAGSPSEGAPMSRLVQAGAGNLHPAVAAAAAPADTSTGGTPPPAPTSLTLTLNQARTEANLNWSAVDTATGYNVYSGSSPGGESPTPILSNISGTSATIVGLTPNQKYYFTVAAVNADGVSGFSPEARVDVSPNGNSGAFAPLLLAPLLGAAVLRRRRARG